MHCWQCGIEPDETYEVTAMDRDGAVAIVARWPAATDHEHVDSPPTPTDLAESGDVALLNIWAEWTR